MNLRAYLRGIGAGMIVAALVMSVSMKPAKDPATVIDKTTLIESVSSASATVSASFEKEDETAGKEDNKESTSSASVSTETSAETENAAETPENSTETSASTDDDNIGSAGSEDPGEAAGEETADENETDNEASESAGSSINPMPEGDPGYTEEGDTVEIRVIRGDSSVSVSRRMFEAGLVESAVEFDKYLCANGYDKSISVGTYQIEFGLDFETMAKIITRRN